MHSLIRRTLRLLIFLAVTSLTVACDYHQDLCFDHNMHDRFPVDVFIEHVGQPQVSDGTTSLFLFPQNNSGTLQYDLSGTGQHEILTPVGKYTAIAVNSDSETIRIGGKNSLSTFEIRLRDAYEMQGLGMRSDNIPRAPGAETERMAMQPDTIWRARIDDLSLSPDITGRYSMHLSMEEAVFHYNVEITEVENLSGIMSLSASLSGMSGSLLASDGTVTPENVTITFGLTPSGTTTLSGQVRTFGHCGISRSRVRSRELTDDQTKHYLTVYAILADGTRWYQSYDVSSQVETSTSENTNVLTVKGLALPAALAGNLQIGVGKWKTIEHLLPM